MKSIYVKGEARLGGADVGHLEKLMLPSRKREGKVGGDIRQRGGDGGWKGPEGGPEDGKLGLVRAAAS